MIGMALLLEKRLLYKMYTDGATWSDAGHLACAGHLLSAWSMELPL